MSDNDNIDGKDQGVEKENEPEIPFNADKISITSIVVPMTRLLERLEEGTIKAPEIQREEDIWDISAQSRLIESLMLKIPLPLFYVAADKDENWFIVDGLQRVSTMRKFLSGKQHQLQDLEFLKDYNWKRFKDLPPRYVNRVKETQLQFAVINHSTPPEVQRNIFKRLNTGGSPLSAQEIRHALYYGPSAELLKKLATSRVFKVATTNSIQDKRMEAREIILRGLAFILRSYKTYPKNDDMDTFLCDTMQILNILPDVSPEKVKNVFLGREINVKCKYLDLDTLSEKFMLGVKRATKLYGKYAFRKTTPLSEYRTRINKALFEMNVSILSEISSKRFQYLLDNKTKLYQIIERDMDSEDIGLEKLISKDSLKTKNLNDRFKLYEDYLCNNDLNV